MSAKERRILKKYGGEKQEGSAEVPADADNDFNNTLEDDQEESAVTESVAASDSKKLQTPSIISSSRDSTSKAGAAAAAPLPRGKKSKLRKMKDKYADQSEDEKEVMMALLHGSEKTDKKNKAQEMVDAAAAAAQSKRQNPQQKQQKQQQQQQNATKVLLAAGKGSGISSSANGEFTGDTAPIEDVTNLAVLEQLTSQPHPDDSVLFAIPVCAPWTCLSKYKYKVKLVPGSLKKGKAAKSAEALLKAAAQNSGDKRDADLVSLMVESEVVAAMLGKVKIMGGGGAGEKKKSTK
ncbi:hypothetical protein HK100_007304 [Physocladia obscura]|uniref:NFACT protein C-terminal domain-containing protein n=1 Tax=Physocladia obscura TaxID=109957 RepID=A0AAD5SRV2_9FUNG|nr:hypothetical protein HK100_007304 [Physocladia obscura]